MKNSNNVSTYTKILLLIFVSGILFFTLFFSIYYYTIEQEKKVYQNAEKQFSNEINALLGLNSESQIAVIKDITYWDELVKFVKVRDTAWFKASIASLLQLYKVDYIGVYNLKGNFISSANSSKIKTSDFLDIKVLPFIHQKRITRYYQRVPDGVIEVFAATINNSDDPYKKKYASGYFFMARLLNKDYVKSLEKISNSSIIIVEEKKEQNQNQNENIIVVQNDLDYWNGKSIAHLAFTRNFDVSFSATKKSLIILIVVLITLLSLVIFYLRKWIFMPLGLVTRILETGNKKAIKLLKETQGEFKHIGDLFEDNSLHQQQLTIAKNKAEESDRLKTAFLTNLSHEIRTPMNAIIGFSELLGEEALTNQEKIEYLKIIKSSGANLVSIIDDLIEMSKIDSNLITPNNVSIEIDAFMDQLYNAIKVTIPKTKKIDFLLFKSKNKLSKKIITDSVKLNQIVTNLLTNAIKFTNEGFIKLSYEWQKKENKIEIIVEDSGIGIDNENQNLIFDRFRRVDSDYSVKAGGLGLGLAISKAYVEMLGGEIFLQSEIGKGSRFRLTIPAIYQERTEENPIEAVDNKPTNSSSQNFTLLVAEDDNINFLLFERIIKNKNYTVIRAKDGEEAVKFTRNLPEIDLILMDIKMPRLSGFDAYLKIRTFNQKIPIIAQTAFSSSEEIDKINQIGFDNYITKPIDKEKLFEILNQYLKQKQ